MTPEQAGDEPSVTLVASRDAGVFRKHQLAGSRRAHRRAARQPAVPRRAARRRRRTLTLTFPTPEYEEEFGGVRRYLPDSLTLDADLRGPLRPAHFGAAYTDLRRRRILLDTPPRYC